MTPAQRRAALHTALEDATERLSLVLEHRRVVCRHEKSCDYGQSLRDEIRVELVVVEVLKQEIDCLGQDT